jgi:two-component system, OmpR family, response regulator
MFPKWLIMKTIFIVEDDIELNQLISRFLKSKGFRVKSFYEGDVALHAIIAYQPDLLLLDMMLPGVDGLHICKAVRQHYKQPILMLTAIEERVVEISALNVGADDYMKKPIEPDLLLARVHALLRRGVNSACNNGDKDLRFGGLLLLSSSQKVTLNQVDVALTNKEYELLYFLAQNDGVVLHRNVISRALHGVDYDPLSSRVIDLRIASLRKKLGDTGKTALRIKTIWGKGYLFDPLAWD